MNTVPFIDLTEQHKKIRREILQSTQEVLDSQQFVLKSKVASLEEKVASYCGAKYAVGLASGSDALYLSLVALGIGPGDEVITTPFTFFATAGSISRTGAKPVFVDIDSKTFNLDPEKIKGKLSPKTKAIIPVHLFGLSCDMNAIGRLARENSLAIVEDSAQSFGAIYEGKISGSLGELGCFSFYPTKNFGGAGDGGMTVTSSEKLANRLRLLRDHGAPKKYYHDEIGINSRLDEIQAAVLLVKLKYIDAWNALRRKHAAAYDAAFKELPVNTPFVPKDQTHTYHLYSILTRQRDQLLKYLSEHGIGAGVYYPLPLHLQVCYKDLGYRVGDCPVSENTAQEIISLPMYPELSQGQVDRVIETVRDFFRQSK